MKKLNVALVGMHFGGAFAGIYKAHPNVGEVTLFDVKPDVMKNVAEYIGGGVRLASSLRRS